MTKPNVNHNARYKALLSEIDNFASQSTMKEKDLLNVSGDLKAVLSAPGIDAAERMAAEFKINRIVTQIERLQSRRSSTVQRLISKAENAFQEMMTKKADADLGRSEVIAFIAKNQSEYSKVLRSIQRYIQRQVQTAIELYTKTREELNSIQDAITDAVTKSINEALSKQRDSMTVGARTLETLGSQEAANDPEAPTVQKPKGVGKRILAPGKNTPQSPSKVEPAPSDDAFDDEPFSYGKTPPGRTYEKLKEDALSKRLVRALEMLSFKRQYSMQQGAGAILGGLAAGALASQIWAPLKAFARLMEDPAKILRSIKGYVDSGLKKLRSWSEGMWEETKKLGDRAWLKLKEWGTLAEGELSKALSFMREKATGWVDDGKTFLAKMAEKLGLVSPEAKAGATAAGEAGLGAKVAAAGSKVLNVVKQGASAVGSAASTAANYVGDKAKLVGQHAVNAAKYLGNKGWDVAQRAGSYTLNAISKLSQSPVGQFIGKWVNRIGNLGMVFSTIMGVMEEAEGKVVDEIKVWEAIFDPMKAGRYLGNKFNKLFEKVTGTSVGSWIYDMLNDDPDWIEAMKEKGNWSLSAMRPQGQGATPVRTKPNAPATRIPSRNLKSAQAPVAPPQKTVKPASAGVVPSSIPDHMGSDPTMMGLNLYAFGA